MNVYNEEEINRINKVKDTNDKLEEYFKDKRETWNENINPLFSSLALDLNLVSNSKKLLEAQATALSFKQVLNEEVNYFLNKRSKEETKIKKLKQDKFIFYATGFGVKTNMGEKTILIDGHLAENDRAIQMIEMHVDFLRSSGKNLETFGYGIKNMIELMNYLGGK
jgi:threonine synthase